MLFDDQLVGDGSLQPAAFDRDHYVPVILTRQGERLALRELQPNVRKAMTPLFVVHPIDDDPKTGLPKRSPRTHLGLLAKQLAKDWGTRPAFADLRFVKPVELIQDLHPLTWFVLECRKAGLLIAPAMSGAHDPAYRAAAAEVSQQVRSSIAIRLGPEEWPNIGSPLGDGHVLSLLAEAGRPANEVHLIIDLERLSGALDITAAALKPALKAMPHATEWASLSMVGTGMPDGTQEVGQNKVKHIERLEWTLWRSLSGYDYRQPTYGDYGVQSPNPLSDFNPLFMDSSAQLRYTTNSSWYVARGRGLKVHGNGQIHSLAQMIVNEPTVFSGEGFSWGDRWLKNCAEHKDGPGDQRQWRKVTTNHHLTFVVAQIANPHGT
jgi:hypothetical protein